MPAGKELISDTKRLFENWVRNADPERDQEKKGSVFGKACRYTDPETGMTLAYNTTRLEEILRFMKENNGRME